MQNSKEALVKFKEEFIDLIIDRYSSAKEEETIFFEKIEKANLIKVLDKYQEVLPELEVTNSNIFDLIDSKSSIYLYLNTSEQNLKTKIFESKYGKSLNDNQDELDQEAAQEAQSQYEELRNKFEEDVTKLDSIVK
jgi:hypothetical protein